jgi:hypothetical protein
MNTCKTVLLVLFVVALLVVLTPNPLVAAPTNDPALALASVPDRARVGNALTSSPVMFIENAGQFADGTRFQVRGGNGTIWLTEDASRLTILGRNIRPSNPLFDLYSALLA